MQTFEWKNGKLYHYVNGELRVTVPAESLADYRETCPEAPDEPAQEDKPL